METFDLQVAHVAFALYVLLLAVAAVTDIRGFGLLGGIDLSPDDMPGARGHKVLKELYAAGVMTKLTGDCVLVSPPLILEDKHIDELFTKIRDVLKTH